MERSRVRRLLRDRDFRFLLSAQTLTMLGDVALILVLGIWVKDLTGSNGAAGSVFLVLALPALVTPLAGPLIDRFPRRTVMIVNDLATATVVLSLLAVGGRDDIWIIYMVAFLYGAAQMVFFAARSGLLVSMLPEEQLPEANGLQESLRHGLRIVGPLVGAGLFALWGGGAVAVLDASMFVLSAVLLGRMRVRDLDRRTAPEPFRTEVTAGARHLVRTLDLRRVVFYTAAVLTALGILEVAIFALLEDGLGKPAEYLGVLSTIQGVGAVAGGFVAATVMARIGEVRLAGAALAALGVVYALDATGRLEVVLGAAILAGICISFYFVAYQTLLQRRTPMEMQGRVFTASEAVLTLPYTLSIALGAVLVGVVDFRILYLGTGAVMLLGGMLLVRAGAEHAPTAVAARTDPRGPDAD